MNEYTVNELKIHVTPIRLDNRLCICVQILTRYQDCIHTKLKEVLFVRTFFLLKYLNKNYFYLKKY